MLKRKLSLLLILFMISLLFTPSVLAPDWSKTQEDGTWVTCERLFWVRDGWYDGNATWQTTVDNFQGYYLNFTFTAFDTYREWWQWNSWMDIWVRIKIDDGNSSLWTYLKIQGFTDAFGLSKGSQAWCGLGENMTSWQQLWDEHWEWLGFTADRDDRQHEIYIRPEGHVTWVIQDAGVPPGSGENNLGYTWNFTHDFTGKTVTITLNYYHGGQGKAWYSATEQFSIPSVTPYRHGLQPMPNPFLDFLHMLSDIIQNSMGPWFSYLTFFLAVVWNGVTLSIHYLPIIVLFWFLDAIITSVVEGDLHPIGTCFMTIYNMARAIISTILSFVGTIWDLITFWS